LIQPQVLKYTIFNEMVVVVQWLCKINKHKYEDSRQQHSKVNLIYPVGCGFVVILNKFAYRFNINNISNTLILKYSIRQYHHNNISIIDS